MSKMYDFSGWATRNNIRCSDGRTILEDAFEADNGKNVPLVWNHQHNDPLNVLGHAKLENRKEGVYAYCTFNNTEAGISAKELVKHGDIQALSIYANDLKYLSGGNVSHGVIREVSLVLAGANPEAYIDNIRHSADEAPSMDEAIIYTGDDIYLEHSQENQNEEKKEKKEVADKEKKEKEEVGDKEKTIKDVFNTLNDEQKDAVYAMIGAALEEANLDNGDEEDEDEEEEDEGMKHNVFENRKRGDELKHSEDLMAVISDGKRYGSLKESALAHGIEHIDYLFPEAQAVTDSPLFIKRDTTWVDFVMNGVGRSPFSRIKSTLANITADEARAKGYIKGKKKVEEVITLLKRSTTPTTIYKKQKIDRDDVIDITDFDVVAWIKSEMRIMLDEEIARAVLIGDGRLASSDDKIKEDCIRPIWTDDDTYTLKETVSSDANTPRAKAFITGCIKARKDYKGSGLPSLYTSEDMLTECLLLEDKMGRPLYESVDRLKTVLRVKDIVTVPVMENQKRTVGSKEHKLMGIIVNLADYRMGADKGGEVNMFDDFDIDYNAQKYLIETRCSGALVVPMSAIVIEEVADTTGHLG
jgi:caudovirus prohead protease|uniref:Major capsid protein n=1 Tax=Siphoviridae sp. ctoiA13 TaxID=2826462 RepID=A0A8S5QZ95_9CAUD|nr:MAG TPA: major capsid protein [Siphoviridae sp. ctoiA13]